MSLLGFQSSNQLSNNLSFSLFIFSTVIVKQFHLLRSQLNLQAFGSNWSWRWHKSLRIGSTLVDYCATILSSTVYTHHHTMQRNRAVAGRFSNGY